MEISNIPNREFRAIVIIKVLIGLEKRVENLSETFNKEIRNIKRNQPEMKNLIAEFKIH